jgi:CHRD domain-containing protein
MELRKMCGVLTVLALAVLLNTGSAVSAQSQEREFRARLEGAQETPAISTLARGAFRASLNPAGDELTFEMEYSGLEGGNTLFAHVHIGQKGVAGGVMFFLCGGGGKPACPNGQGVVSGTVNASNVTGPAGQGIAAGEFTEAIRAMRNGLAYANVHTANFMSGEIRGQINDEDENSQR